MYHQSLGGCGAEMGSDMNEAKAVALKNYEALGINVIVFGWRL